MKNRLISILIVIFICFSFIPCNVFAEENDNVENINDLISSLPEMEDPTGAKYYFYRQLNDEEKAIYQEILAMPFDNEGVMYFSGLDKYTQEELHYHAQRALSACISDNPFLHSYWDNCIMCSDGKVAVLSLINDWGELYSSQGIRDEAELRANAIVSEVGLDGDIYTRLRKLITIMTYEMDYNSIDEHDYKTFGNNDCVLGCLIDDYAVCAGFADTLKFLCDKLEIPCIIVGNSGHAWNFVCMENGQWYSVDASAIVPADGFSDETTITNFIEQELLLGSTSPSYTGNSNYFISDLCILPDDNFVFPVLSTVHYEYSGIFEYKYSPVAELELPDLSFRYIVNDDGVSCTIIGCQGKRTGDLIIPETINNYTVTAIGEGAFFNCTGFNGQLVLPSSLKEIKVQAFANCNKLTGIDYFPEGLQRIEDGAFISCKGLTGEIVLPESVQYIGDSAFYNCTNLTGDFFIPDAVDFTSRVIELTGIQSVSISDSNKKYKIIDGLLLSKDGKTLLYCPLGRTGALIVPDGVTRIEDSACSRCRYITDLFLPNSLIYIGNSAFRDCISLSGDLILPDSIETIGDSAFLRDMNYSYGGSLHLPSNLKILGNLAFTNCGFTGELFIPDSLEKIEGEMSFHANSFSSLICSESNTVFIKYYNESSSAFKISNSYPLRLIEHRDNYEITISFNANGGENAPKSFKTLSGFSFVLDQIPVREGFEFMGWNEDPTSQEIFYREGGRYYFEEDKELYAVWEESSAVIRGITDDFTWVQYQNEITIIGYSGIPHFGQLVIPDYLDGLPVCGIGPSVFEGIRIRFVSFPITLQWVGENNFSDNVAFIGYQGSRSEWERIVFADGNDSIRRNGEFYSWPDDFSTVTATRINVSSVSTETVNTQKEIEAYSNCTDYGSSRYTAYFTNFHGEFYWCVYDVPPTGHAWGETVYTWSDDNRTVTAKRVCANDSSHIETETVETDVVTLSACETDGARTYSAVFTNPAFEKQIKTEIIPVTGHAWGETVYTWSDDNRTVTAKRVCANDSSHIETETVETDVVTVAVTCVTDGEIKYTANFMNPVFENQTKTETIPAQGHMPGEDIMENEEDATCESDGSYDLVVYCTECGEEIVREKITIPATGHAWGETVYTWSEDYSTVTAKRVCTNDSSHIETETVETTYEILIDATIFEDGSGCYFAVFDNPAFEAQEMSVTIVKPFKVGWVRYNDVWYYFNANGVMQTGWIKLGGVWYYLDSSGIMQTGWIKISGAWYYLNSSGVMQTGWVMVGGFWYYLDSSGVMQTGWIRSGGAWYYLDSSGVMQTGWIKSGSSWYFMDPKGEMKTGWIKSGRDWYYLDSNGEMKTGWVKSGRDWYYMNSNGAMQTGWVKSGYDWYYMDDCGAMLENTNKIIGGVIYYFDTTGVCTNP